MKKLFILTGILFICFHSARGFNDARQKRVDSLQKIVEKGPHDTLRIQALIKLAYEQGDSLELAIDYNYQALKLGKALNDPRIIARINFAIGDFYAFKGLSEKAFDYMFKAYHYFKKTQDKVELTKVIRRMVAVYYLINDNKNNGIFSKEGLALAQQTKDTTSTVTFLNSLGLVALRTQRLKKALEYFERALVLEKQSPDKSLITTLFNNIGMTYNQMENYDKALEYLFKSIEVAKQLKDKIIAYAKKYELSKEDVQNKYKFGVGNTYINIGTVCKNKKEFEKSIKYSMKGIELISHNKRAFYQYQKVYNTLTQVYEAKETPLLALKNYKLYITARDSFNALAIDRRFDQLESKHVADKKEKEIETLKREAEITSQRNRAVNTALGGGLFLMLTLAGLIYKRYDEKRKSHNVLEEQNHEITAQNHEISAQRDQIAEKSQKLEYAYHNITDSIEYAHRIQEALLPSQALIQKALPESMVMLKPRDVVSGDFYWFAQTGNLTDTSLEGQKVILAAVDCTGHGVPGAFMSMAGDAYLNQIVKQQGITQPDKVLCNLHQNIRQSLKQETTGNRDGMDISLVEIDRKNKTVSFAGARNPLIYIQDGELHLIRGDKYSIGGEQREGERSFTTHSVRIDPENPTTFYLFSDGFQDQFGGKEGKKFLVRRFRELLLSIHHLSMQEQKSCLESTFNDWLGGLYEQVDDVLVIGFKV